MIKKTSSIISLVTSIVLLSLSSSARAAIIDVSSLFVDTVSANVVVGSVIDTGASTSIVPPAEITMGSYQDPILDFSNSFSSGSFDGTIYSSGTFGEPAPSASVDTGLGVFSAVDLSSLRMSGTLTSGSITYSFDTELWPVTTPPTLTSYDAGTGAFSLSWIFSDMVSYDISSILGSTSGSFDTSFDLTISGYATVVPVPAAIWLFASGLLALFGSARIRKR